MKKLLVSIFCAVGAFAARADGLDALAQFVQTVHTGRAAFTQVVTTPAREGRSARTRTSSGVFEFSRPHRFRFTYRKPFEQIIVADGQTLWMYDADLNQVTARQQSQILDATPAALIAAAPDLRALRADFELRSEPTRDGLEWVAATPRAREGQLKLIRVGFRSGARGAELAVLEIHDNFGQRSVLSFSQVEVNPRLASDVFRFKAPAGVDVIRQ